MAIGSWRQRAGRSVVDPVDPRGTPITTPTDRRWLWRIEGDLAVLATTDALRQLGQDIRQYLDETCEHHWLHYDGDEVCREHRQCLWCNEVEWMGGGDRG